jgi:hypothetical protein
MLAAHILVRSCGTGGKRPGCQGRWIGDWIRYGRLIARLLRDRRSGWIG